MISFLILLCFSLMEAKNYYMGLNISGESSCESLESCLNTMNETSIIYIGFNNTQIILHDYIRIFKNLTIYNIGLNNELVLNGAFIYGYKISLSLINIALLFNILYVSPSISIEEGSLTLQVFLVSLILIYFIKGV